MSIPRAGTGGLCKLPVIRPPIARAEREALCKLAVLRPTTTAYSCNRPVHKPKTFSPVTLHFLIRVLPNPFLHNKLRLPKEFMMKYGKTLSNPVVIRVPSGAKWKIGLTKFDGDVWLDKGWPEFARQYSLDIGQTLCFRYEGSSQFDVVIVGINGLEINYPITDSARFNEPGIDDGDGDNDDASSHPKTNEKSAPPFSCTQKRMKRTLGDTPTQRGSQEMNLQNPTSIGDYLLSFKSKEMIVENHGKEPQVRAMKQRSLSRAEKARALSRTKDFTSQYPHFKVIIQKVHLHDHYKLVIPISFWFEHLYKIRDDATLSVSDGRTWPAMLNVSDVGKEFSMRVSFQRSDWREFAEDNDLELGDVCIFELTKKIELSDRYEIDFKVTISRDGDDQNNQLSQVCKSAANQDQLEKSSSARLKAPNTSDKDETSSRESPVDNIAVEGSEHHHEGEINVGPQKHS